MTFFSVAIRRSLERLPSEPFNLPLTTRIAYGCREQLLRLIDPTLLPRQMRIVSGTIVSTREVFRTHYLLGCRSKSLARSQGPFVVYFGARYRKLIGVGLRLIPADSLKICLWICRLHYARERLCSHWPYDPIGRHFSQVKQSH